MKKTGKNTDLMCFKVWRTLFYTGKEFISSHKQFNKGPRSIIKLMQLSLIDVLFIPKCMQLQKKLKEP